jgi:purine-binding chemotaxis protein CheW
MTNQQNINVGGSSSDQRNLVVFRLARQSYALPVERVRQIISMVAITPIPQVSDVVEGVINVRGTIVPVVNLSHHLGLQKTPLQLYTPILLTQTSEGIVGLIVDEVTNVFSFPDDQITRPVDILPEGLGQAPVLQGLTYNEGNMVSLLDLNHLFLPEQMQALTQAMDALSKSMAEEKTAEETTTKPQPKPKRKRRRKTVTKEASEETQRDESTRKVET